MTVDTIVTSRTRTELPAGWRTVRFCDAVRNVDINVRNPIEVGIERYVGLDHLDPESLHIKRWGLVEEGTTFTRKFTAGQVLFGKRRAYQRKAAVAEFEGICSGDILVFEPSNGELIPDLLPFIVQSDGFFNHALGTSAGSLSPRTKWKDLAAYEFVLPPRDQQRRIAEILWAADEAVEKWLAVSNRIDGLLMSLRETVVCDERFPRMPLAEALLDLIPGKSVLGVNEPASSTEYGVLKVSAVGADGFVPNENKSLIDPSDFRSEFAVRSGDFLITRCNTTELVGRVCLVSKDYDNLMLCDKTIRLNVREDVASKTYLLEAMKSTELRSQIEASATGTGGAMKNISQADIRGYQMPLPPLAIQLEISSKLQRMHIARRDAGQHLTESRTMKQSLLNSLLSNHFPIN